MAFADLGSFLVSSSAETIGQERAELAKFWSFTKKGKSARTLGNPNEHAGIGKKNPTGDPVGFYVWWSWGDSNPRPRAILEQIYMFSGLI